MEDVACTLLPYHLHKPGYVLTEFCSCGEDGHFARDCPDKPEGGTGGLTGECFNCGEVGHNKSDCTNPRVEREFTGECRVCAQTGHRAADCPSKPPRTCAVCHEEGHVATDCTINRMIAEMFDMGIKDVSSEEAWRMVEVADDDKDLDDIKQELESTFRETDMNTYLIAKQQEVSETQTIINLQGKQGQTYVVSFQFSAKPRRAKMAEGWPSSAEENHERLAEAGRVVNSMIPKCNNCDQMGHNTRECPEDKVERVIMAITCANCNEEGHRARDCTQARKSGRRGCKNCGEEGHIAKECPEPPNPENVECRNCNQLGHFSKDCPDREPEICHNCQEEGHRAKDCTNERVMKCRNCDELGHMSRQCPKPTDWARVECSNCKEKGHSYKRCPLPPVVEAPGEDAGDTGYDTGVASGGWNEGGDTAATAFAAASVDGDGCEIPGRRKALGQEAVLNVRQDDKKQSQQVVWSRLAFFGRPPKRSLRNDPSGNLRLRIIFLVIVMMARSDSSISEGGQRDKGAASLLHMKGESGH
nr:cellular nucleic acid-binding protein like [Quercus suber]